MIRKTHIIMTLPIYAFPENIYTQGWILPKDTRVEQNTCYVDIALYDANALSKLPHR